MNYYLKTCSAMDGKPVCDTQGKNSFDPRYNELMGKQGAVTHLRTSTLFKYDESEFENTGFFCAQCDPYENIKKGSAETQVFVKLCGSTISLQKNLKSVHVEMLSEAACVKAGVKSNDFYSTFCGKILEPKQLLANYNIKKECTIRMNPRLRGGSSDENWDQKISGLERYHTVFLPADLVKLKLTNQCPIVVKYLGKELQYRSQKVLIYLCRKHYSGVCFGGHFTSQQIVFDGDDNVRINASPLPFNLLWAFDDYQSLYRTLDKAFKDEVDKYPMLTLHLLSFLQTPPPEIDPRSDSVIAFLTNHLSLLSHTQRIAISDIMVILLARIGANDKNLLKSSIATMKWTKDVTDILAMKARYYYHYWYNLAGEICVPYNDTAISLLEFSNNFFKHSPRFDPEQLDAAFSFFMELNNFMAQLVYDALVTFEAATDPCPDSVKEFVDKVIGMLGNNTLGCKMV